MSIVLVVASSVWPSLAGASAPKDRAVGLDGKEFFRPELAISTEHVPLEDVRDSLPNRDAWVEFQSVSAAGRAPGQGFHAYIDPRSGAASNLLGPFPILPGDGVGNRLTLESLRESLGIEATAVTEDVVARAVRAFVRDHRAILNVDDEQLGEVRAEPVREDLWQFSIPQVYRGVRVRDARVAGTIVKGNLVVIGAETFGPVNIDTSPYISAAEALERGFAHAEGRLPQDEILQDPTLEIIPFAAPEFQVGAGLRGSLGKGYGHRLAWTFTFRRPPAQARYEVMVDAGSGEVLAFQDANQYAQRQIKGGVYPLTNTGSCPDPATCGSMQSGWPMPFADTGLAAPNNFTNSAGIFDWTGGTVTTTLRGPFVKMFDNCGTIRETSPIGDLDLGGIAKHNCKSSGASPGDTPSSRSAFYEVNKLAELARGWLPNNAWLRSQLTTNVNIIDSCNAFWDGFSINFYRSGGGCRNTGEIAGVFDHEWGHGLDHNDAGGSLSNSSEAYADIAAIYRLQTSCVGYGFYETVDNGCGVTADGTGTNASENGVRGQHCDLNCSGVRDADWALHSPSTPDTALGFVCNECSSGTGPCGRQVHCAAAPSRQAAWDLVGRDLRSPPFNLDNQNAFIIGNKLFYQGSGNIGSWHACACGSSSSGCGATNGYMQWLAADDDNGNLSDGTPHMTAIFNAFNRHGIACASPTPVNGGCAGGPTASPTLNGSAGNYSVGLSWDAVGGATRYWVFRTEGHAGCRFGKALIAETTGTNFTDGQVANGRAYNYNVVAAGASSACFAKASNCLSVTPAAGGDTVPPTTDITSPANGATVSGLVTVTASATDNVGVTRVEFLIDDAVRATDTQTPYSFDWNTTAEANGSHRVVSHAFDAANNMGTSPTVTVTVGTNPPDNPITAITSPPNGATVSGTVTISASASDNVGVTRVEFWIDGVLRGSDTQTPYTFDWNTLPESSGPHTLFSRAFDAANNMGQSPTISVTVNNVTASCTVTAIDSTRMEFPADGGEGTNSFAVSPPGCTWTASTQQADWISVAPASGTGNGVVTVTTGPNFLSFPRFGSVTISDRVVTIVQEAR